MRRSFLHSDKVDMEIRFKLLSYRLEESQMRAGVTRGERSKIENGAKANEKKNLPFPLQKRKKWKRMEEALKERGGGVANRI